MSRAFRPALFALLVITLHAVSTFEFDSGGHLVRRKREWIPPPKELEENIDYTQEEFVAKIHSDFDNGKGNLLYSLEGIGASKYPFNVFVVDRQTGKIQVTKKLNREEIATYNLSGVATFTNGLEAEKNIDIRFKVVDQNDNSPQFPLNPGPGNVKELSAPGTPVMKFAATDIDEPGNPNSQIKYSIVKQDPPDNMFSITDDGTIIVVNPMLDREKTDQYTLIVKGADLNGQPGGRTGTGTVVIKVEDVNDNPPTLEKLEYEGSIDENVKGIEVMRLKSEDLDVVNTENWQSVFEIVKGNEAKYFSIKTDPNTNEGVLMLDKAVNFEDVKDLDLGIIVKNKAPPYSGSGSSGANVNVGGGTGGGGGGGAGAGGGGGGGAGAGGGGGGGAGAGGGGGGGAGGGGSSSGGSSWQSSTGYKTYPVKINVNDMQEGPIFDPKVKAIPMSEGGTSFSLDNVIGTYPAIDQDTGKPAKNVRYIKGADPDNWLYIDPETAEIKLNKKPDRESPFLVNGTYYAKVLCITEDMPSKTATGTVGIQVEDFNDNCPIITSEHQTLCTNKDAVIVRAKDEDSYPNGPPFHFSIIPEDTEGKWQVEHFNDTAAILRAQEPLWPGVYKVGFLIKDEQGVACPDPQKVEVVVCTCENGVMCGGKTGQPKKNVALGPAGIGLLLLGLLLLLLLPLLLLFCLCGGAGGQAGEFTEMPFDSKAHLVNYRTEGQGDNTAVPLLNMPMQMDADRVEIGTAPKTMTGMGYEKSLVSMDGGMNGTAYHDNFMREGAWGAMNQNGGNEFYSTEFNNKESSANFYDDMALSHRFLGQYYTQKLNSEKDNGVKDNFLVYDYEGQGSPAGSVGCCSLLESDNDLHFLDDIGPKFKTLAEVCGGKPIPSAPAPRPPSVSHTIVSNVSSALPLPSPPKPAVSTTETVVKEISERSQAVKERPATVRQGVATVKTGAANQGQMFLLQQQQPVYYATTPMMQPMQYVVQPQVPATMMLTNAPATNLQNMVLVNGAQTGAGQGMVLVNGAQTGATQGMVVQGSSVMSVGQAKGPGMVLVQSSGLRGNSGNLIQAGNLAAQTGATQGMVLVNGAQTGATQGIVVQGPSVMSVGQAKGPGMMLVESSGLRGNSGNLVQAGNLSGAQTMMVVEGQAPAGSLKVLRGNQANFVQGSSLQPAGISGSQQVMVVEGSTGSGGRLVQGSGGLSLKSKGSGSLRNLPNKGSMSTGSQRTVIDSSGSMVTTTPSYQKVVVKETFTEL